MVTAGPLSTGVMAVTLVASGRVDVAVSLTWADDVGTEAASPSSDCAIVVAWSHGVFYLYGR